jgi:DNA-binding transcriptional LysR family regulator
MGATDMSAIGSDHSKQLRWGDGARRPREPTKSIEPASASKVPRHRLQSSSARHMNFKALNAFQLIAERGSLSAAATDMCLSQPAVSRLISQLESELELQLFNRTGRALTMTREGKLFYETTKNILAGLQEIPRIAKAIQAGDQDFQMVTTARIAQAIISPALTLLRREKPNLRCRVDVLSREDLDSAIRVRQFDLAIAVLPVVPSAAVETTPLFKVRLEAVLPKHHGLVARNCVTASDLADETLIGPWQDENWRREMGGFLPAGELSAKSAVETPSALMAFQMASDGAGIAFLDRLSARGLDHSGVEFRPLAPARWIEFGCVRRRDTPLNATALAFLNMVRQLIEEIKERDPKNAEAIELANNNVNIPERLRHS